MNDDPISPVEGPAAAPEADLAQMDYAAELERLESEYQREQEAKSAEVSEDGQWLDESATDPFATTPDLTNRVASLEEHNRLLEAHVAEGIRQRDIADALKTVRDSYDLDIGDAPLRQLMTGMVNEDIGLFNAWHNRHEDPGTWQNALKHMGRAVAKDFTRNDLTPTSDIEAIEASVRGQTVDAPRKRIDASRVGDMTHAEYANWKREHLGS